MINQAVRRHHPSLLRPADVLTLLDRHERLAAQWLIGLKQSAPQTYLMRLCQISPFDFSISLPAAAPQGDNEVARHDTSSGTAACRR